MRLRVFTLLSAALVLSLVTAGRAQQDDVKALLERAGKAHGGAAVAKFTAGKTKNKGRIEIHNGLDFTQEISYQLPNKFREEMDLEVMGQKVKSVTVYDGTKGSIEINGKPLPLNDDIKNALKEAADMFGLSRLTGLDKKGYEFSSIGEAQVNGKPALGVRISKKGVKDISMYFDKETGLTAKVERRTLDLMSGQEVTEERIILEYQKIDNIPTPKRVVVNRDGKKFLEAEVLEVKMFEKLGDNEFTVP